MVAEEGEHPVHENRWLVVHEVGAVVERVYMVIVIWHECAKQPVLETFVILCGVGHGLDVVKGSDGDILGQSGHQVGVLCAVDCDTMEHELTFHLCKSHSWLVGPEGR